MSWRENIEAYLNRSPIDINEIKKKTYKYSGTEPGISHPNNNSSVKLRDDGCIDIFAGNNLGIRLDPNAGSVNIFGDKINLWSSTTSIHTDQNSLLWNYNPLNPNMYTEILPHLDEDLKILPEPWDYKVSGTRKEWDELNQKWVRKPYDVYPYLKNKEKEIISSAMNKFMNEIK